MHPNMLELAVKDSMPCCQIAEAEELLQNKGNKINNQAIDYFVVICYKITKRAFRGLNLPATGLKKNVPRVTVS